MSDIVERLRQKNKNLADNCYELRQENERLRAKCNQRRDDLKQARDILDERFKEIERLRTALRDALLVLKELESDAEACVHFNTNMAPGMILEKVETLFSNMTNENAALNQSEGDV